MTQPPTDPDQPHEPPAQPGSPYGPPAYPPTSPPSYPPYGAPGQPPYGPHPGAPVQDAPDKGLAIAALVSSLVCCLPLGLVLGVIVLRRGRDGRDHGRAFAIAAICINAMAMLAVVGLVVLGGVLQRDVREVADLEPGDCISAEGFQGDAEAYGTITEQDCFEAHDAEVLAVGTLSAEDVAVGGALGYAVQCEAAMSAAARDLLLTDRDSIDLLTIYEIEEPGEPFACLAVAPGHGQLSDPLVP